MNQPLQTILDQALLKHPRSSDSVRDDVHFVPVAESRHRAEILTRLKQRDLVQQGRAGGGLHIGVAGAFNFSIAAVSHPSAMVLLDVNEHQRAFWLDVIGMLRNCKTPEAFREAMKAHMREDQGAAPAPSWQLDSAVPWSAQSTKTQKIRWYPASYHLREVDPQMSVYRYLETADWLCDQQAYTFLHIMAKNDRIATATVDVIYDQQRCKALGDALANQKLITDTCYWSNIGQYPRPYQTSAKHYVPAQASTDEEAAVFSDQLCYPDHTFYRVIGSSRFWNGKEVLPSKGIVRDTLTHAAQRMADGWHKRVVVRAEPGKTLSFNDLPVFERMLRNVSAIGGPEGTHFMATDGGRTDLIVTDGPPRHLSRIEKRRAGELASNANTSPPVR